jgi:hypothetical protein
MHRRLISSNANGIYESVKQLAYETLTSNVKSRAMGTGGRRLEHDYATRRNRHRGAGLRVTADTLTFLEIFRHGSVSLPFQNPDYREMRIAA